MAENDHALIMLRIPNHYRDALSRLADERRRRNPHKPVNVDIIAEEAIHDFLDRYEQMETRLRP